MLEFSLQKTIFNLERMGEYCCQIKMLGKGQNRLWVELTILDFTGMELE